MTTTQDLIKPIQNSGALIILFILVLFGCNTASQKNSPDQSAQDTLLKKFLIDEFTESFDRSWQQNINESIKAGNNSRNELIIYPEKYRLKYYRVDDSFQYSPFVVKVIDSTGNLISLFSFKDEIHYLKNNPRGAFSGERDSITISTAENQRMASSEELDLEKNINDLIEKMGYQRSEDQIRYFLNELFKNALSMEKANFYEVGYLSEQLKGVQNRTPEIDSCASDFHDLHQNFKDWCDFDLCVKAREGFFGYWRFSIVKTGNLYKVKARFFGDLIYGSIYM
jgi:hypothetical protein